MPEGADLSGLSELQKNADRFTGFADLYDHARPKPPIDVRDILVRYLGHLPALTVDLGCGTGLSTVMWCDVSEQVVGIEPSPDMLNIARKKGEHHKNLSFRQVFSDATGLPDDSVDILTCSQSFHWMNPETTLREVDRILKSGGVFAVYDCDWPPVCHWETEHAYNVLFQTVHALERTNVNTKDSFIRWDKEHHLENFRAYGRFRHVREIVFSSTEPCEAERFIAIALSQGGLQALRKAGVETLEPAIAAFEKVVHARMGKGRFSMDFCYRMRVGVK